MGCSCSKSASAAGDENTAGGAIGAPAQQAPITEAVAEQATALYNQFSTAITNATTTKPAEEGVEAPVSAAAAVAQSETVQNMKGAVMNLFTDVTAGISGAPAKKKRRNKKKRHAKAGAIPGDQSSGGDATPAEDNGEFVEAVEGAANQSYEAYYSADSEEPRAEKVTEIVAEVAAKGGKSKKKNGNA